jgi:hypothetical protein
MSDKVTDVRLEAGYIVVSKESGIPYRIAIADALRAADIPALTYGQVSSIKALANLNVILIRTLIDQGILGERFLEDGDYNLDDLVEAIENMGGDYGEPDLTGSET